MGGRARLWCQASALWPGAAVLVAWGGVCSVGGRARCVWLCLFRVRACVRVSWLVRCVYEWRAPWTLRCRQFGGRRPRGVLSVAFPFWVLLSRWAFGMFIILWCLDRIYLLNRRVRLE